MVDRYDVGVSYEEEDRMAAKSVDSFPRTTDELIKEYADLNAVIAKATKRRERLDVQFSKIMEQQARAYQEVRQSAYPQDEVAQSAF